MKLTPRLADALLRLRTNNDFKLFVNSISDYGEEVVQRMMYDPDNRDQHAGSGIAITEILKVVSTAPDRLTKERDRK